MSKLEKLTKAQERLIPKIRDKWIQKALLAGDEIDKEKAERGIAWMYEMANMKAPKVIYVDSPLAVQYAANILLLENGKSDQVRDQVYGQVRDQVRDQVSDQVSDQVYGQVRDQVRDQVSDQVSDQVRDQVSDQVSDQVYGQVYGQVRDQVRDQVSDQVSDQVYGQVRDQVYGQVSDQVYGQVRGQVSDQDMTWFYWAYENLGWRSDDFSFLDFFYQIGVTQHEGLKKYLDYLESGVFFAVFVTDYAIVCRRPSGIRRDEQSRLHNDQKPAIEWRDGYKLYYLDGVAFEEAEWKKIINQEMTLENLAKESMGADKSAVAVKYLRPDLLLEHCNAKLIHTGIKGTKLYEVEDFMGTGTTQYCMRMKHPSIEREYIEWVQPDIGKQENADLAQASAWRDKDGDHIPVEDYLLAVEA